MVATNPNHHAELFSFCLLGRRYTAWANEKVTCATAGQRAAPWNNRPMSTLRNSQTHQVELDLNQISINHLCKIGSWQTQNSTIGGWGEGPYRKIGSFHSCVLDPSYTHTTKQKHNTQSVKHARTASTNIRIYIYILPLTCYLHIVNLYSFICNLYECKEKYMHRQLFWRNIRSYRRWRHLHCHWLVSVHIAIWNALAPGLRKWLFAQTL